MDSSNQENMANDGGNNYETYYESLDHSGNPEVEYPTEFEQLSPLREQDRFLPIANVSKIMKKAVPSNGKISKEAKEIVQECVSEYISFITSEAAEKCQQEKRKTINGEDLLWAMANLGFDQSVDPLRLFLTKYREANKLDSSMLDDSGGSGVGLMNNVIASVSGHVDGSNSGGNVGVATSTSGITGTLTTNDGNTIYIRDGNILDYGSVTGGNNTDNSSHGNNTVSVSGGTTDSSGSQNVASGTIAVTTDASGTTSIYVINPSATNMTVINGGGGNGNQNANVSNNMESGNSSL